MEQTLTPGRRFSRHVLRPYHAPGADSGTPDTQDPCTCEGREVRFLGLRFLGFLLGSAKGELDLRGGLVALRRGWIVSRIPSPQPFCATTCSKILITATTSPAASKNRSRRQERWGYKLWGGKVKSFQYTSRDSHSAWAPDNSVDSQFDTVSFLVFGKCRCR